MRNLILLTVCCLAILSTTAQTVEAVIAELQAVNQNISNKGDNGHSAAAISNRGMNVFLADKTGYLSRGTDLSYYTNYLSFNSTEGRITVNHNFQPAAGTDDRLKTLFSVGFDIAIANSYTKGVFDSRYENELGISLNYKWLDKVKTLFSNGQQQAIDALRMGLLQSLITEIHKKQIDFENTLLHIDSTSLPGQNMLSAKTLLQQNFYEELKSGIEEKFALMQAALLSKTGSFKRISTGWTSLTAYLPIVFPQYYTAGSLTASFSNNNAYPAAILLEHTRLWESSRTGRLFFTAGGNVLLNNTKLSYGLYKLNAAEYKALGGTAGQSEVEAGHNKLYIGSYQTFITPSISTRAVFFPHESHIGVSLLAEQYFGKYNWLNVKLAIPVVLINSQKTPALNFECYLLFLNCNNQPAVSDAGKTQLGFSIGIPFSRLMF
jgi:hypothetical protein